MNYKDLEVWRIARELSIEIHKMTLTLPKFEMYEEGNQIRRSQNQFVLILLRVMVEEDIKMSL